MAISETDLRHWFTYHPATPEQRGQYETIRRAAFLFACVILEATPPSADQTAAIRKIREALMTAGAAIACEGR